MTDVLILGSGVAGLSAAVHAVALGCTVTIATKGTLSASATWYAQGGVAAALGDADSAALHAADTETAGAGLCDPEAVRTLVTEGPERIRALIAMGAVFDRTTDADDAAFAFTREGGHSLARIVHAGGDATGAEIERALVAVTRARAIAVHEHAFALELIADDARVLGAVIRFADGTVGEVHAAHTLLATGGAGQCYAVTTNPALSTGDGIALAARVGAALADLEFMQFHPTALDVPGMPRPLLSEALRGEGAVLRDPDGTPFMASVHPLADLAPRDVVARAIAERHQNGVPVLLDATAIPNFASRFPTVDAACRGAGLDPQRDLLPVAPAAHYLSGGVATDLNGATTVPHLWACGEVACTGVHGANRLASNSLLEGLVFGTRAAEAIAAGTTGAGPSGVLRDIDLTTGVALDDSGGPGDPQLDVAGTRRALQRVMTDDAGVLRDAVGLARATAALADLDERVGSTATDDPARAELANLLSVARRLVRAAADRRETRGTHTRVDAPEPRREFAGRFVHVGDTCVFHPLGVTESV